MVSSKKWFPVGLSLLIVSLSVLAAAQVEKPQRQPSRWAGFVVGSWVTIKQVKKEGGQTREITTRQTISAITDSGEPVIAIVDVPDDPRTSHSDSKPRGSLTWEAAGFTRQSSEPAKLIVGGKQYNCTKETWTLNDEHRKATLHLWRCDDLYVPANHLPVPGRVAFAGRVGRIEAQHQTSHASTTMTAFVTNTAERVKVGEQMLEAVRIEVALSEQRGERRIEGAGFALLSDQVPGRQIKTHMKMKLGEDAVAEESSEVLNYHTADTNE